jgi:hypothetical protein
MKSFHKDLAAYAEKTRLSARERSELRERLSTYMEYHPLPKRMRTAHTTPAASRAAARLFLAATRGVYARIAASALALLLLVVSIPFAAESAVPGDILYPIKTINENIRAQFISSPYEKVQFETELLQRRISEARLLAQEGKLDEATEAQIAETVKDQAAATQRSITDLKASDADEAAIAAITFGSTLDVQSAFFASSTPATDSIANAVREAKEEADLQKGTTTPSYARLDAHVEQSTTRAYELFESIQDSATDGEELQIKRRLNDIDRKVDAAHDAYAADDEGKAVSILSAALTDIQKLISFMTNIDVRENVRLDALVPVELTPEERILNLQAALSDLASVWNVAATSTSTATTTDAGGEAATTTPALPLIVGKAFDEVPALIETASTSLASGDADDVEAALVSAEALMADAKVVAAGDVDPGEAAGGGNAATSSEAQ